MMSVATEYLFGSQMVYPGLHMDMDLQIRDAATNPLQTIAMWLLLSLSLSQRKHPVASIN